MLFSRRKCSNSVPKCLKRVGQRQRDNTSCVIWNEEAVAGLTAAYKCRSLIPPSMTKQPRREQQTRCSSPRTVKAARFIPFQSEKPTQTRCKSHRPTGTLLWCENGENRAEEMKANKAVTFMFDVCGGGQREGCRSTLRLSVWWPLTHRMHYCVALCGHTLWAECKIWVCEMSSLTVRSWRRHLETTAGY